MVTNFLEVAFAGDGCQGTQPLACLVDSDRQKVWALLLESPQMDFVEEEIAEALQMDNGSVRSALAALVEAEVLRVNIRGKLAFYSADPADPLTRAVKRAHNIARVRPLVSELLEHSSRVILYGSCAIGTNTSDSDIDLLVETEQAAAIRSLVRPHPLSEKIQLITRTPAEMASLAHNDSAFYDHLMGGVIFTCPVRRRDSSSFVRPFENVDGRLAASRELERAGHSLKEARDLAELGKSRWAILAACWAIHHTGKAWLFLHGVRPQRHISLVQALEESLVGNGRLAEVSLRKLEYVLSFRFDAAYLDTHSAEQAAVALDVAGEFLQKARQIAHASLAPVQTE